MNEIKIIVLVVIALSSLFQVAPSSSHGGSRGAVSSAEHALLPYEISDHLDWAGYARQWNYGVQLRYTAFGGKAYLALDNFEMTPVEQAQWLMPDELGVRAIQPIDYASLTVDGEPLAFERIGDAWFCSIPLTAVVTSELELAAFNAGNHRIFAKKLKVLAVY